MIRLSGGYAGLGPDNVIEFPDVRAGWVQIEPPQGYVRCWIHMIAPFGMLSLLQPSSVPETWYVNWRPSNASAVFQVTGPHPDREAAQAAALRWLFESWFAIEAQLDDPDEEPALQVSGWVATALVLAALAVVVGVTLLLEHAG